MNKAIGPCVLLGDRVKKLHVSFIQYMLCSPTIFVL